MVKGGAGAGTELPVPALRWAVVTSQLEPVLVGDLCAENHPSIQTLAGSVGGDPCLGLMWLSLLSSCLSREKVEREGRSCLS